eukprot:15342797-Ditylum_brightwellii.AAC.1
MQPTIPGLQFSTLGLSFLPSQFDQNYCIKWIFWEPTMYRYLWRVRMDVTLEGTQNRQCSDKWQDLELMAMCMRKL